MQYDSGLMRCIHGARIVSIKNDVRNKFWRLLPYYLDAKDEQST